MIRWVAAALVAIALHAGAVVFLLSRSSSDPDAYRGDAVEVELMPDIAERSDKPDDVAGQKAAEAAATSETVEADDPTPPAPNATPPTEKEPAPEKTAQETIRPAPHPQDAELTVEKKAEAKSPEPPVETTDAEKDKAERQTEASRASSGAAAQLAGGRRPSARATASWAGEIGTHLAKLRRYPRQARVEGWQGTARVRVTIDGDGHVRGRQLVESSGRPILDDEALALVQRSDPFPKPPAGLPTPVALTVPVAFAIR